MKTQLAIAALILSAVSASAQSKFVHYSTFDKPGATPAECTQETAIIAPLVASFPHPDNWTYIVVCDDAAWSRVEIKLGMSGKDGKLVGVTRLEPKQTFIRGYAILHPIDNSPESQPEHIIAHELCHIALNSADETKVDALAVNWVHARTIASK